MDEGCMSYDAAAWGEKNRALDTSCRRTMRRAQQKHDPLQQQQRQQQRQHYHHHHHHRVNMIHYSNSGSNSIDNNHDKLAGVRSGLRSGRGPGKGLVNIDTTPLAGLPDGGTRGRASPCGYRGRPFFCLFGPPCVTRLRRHVT